MTINLRNELLSATKLAFFTVVTFPVIHFFEEITVHGIKCLFGSIDGQINPNEEQHAKSEPDHRCHHCHHEHHHSHSHHLADEDIPLFSLLILTKIAYANEHLLHKAHHNLFPLSNYLEPTLMKATAAYCLFKQFEAAHTLFHLLEIGEAFKDIFIDHQIYTVDDLYNDAVEHWYFLQDAYPISCIKALYGNITDTIGDYMDYEFLADEL